MKKSITVMADLLKVIPRHRIDRIISESGTDYRVRRLSTFQLLTVMLFGQITNAYSIREIEHGPRVHQNHLYHSGMVPVKRSTLSDAMNKRTAEVFERIYHDLVSYVMTRNSGKKRRFKNPLRAVDSTTIPLSIERFDWAKFRKAKGGIKLHVSYDVDKYVATQAVSTHASVGDLLVLPVFKHGDAIQVLDRGYLSFKALYEKELREERDVTRIRHNTNCRVLEAHSGPSAPGVESDSVVKLDNPRRHIDYPTPARLVEYRDPQTGKRFRFLTNI